MIDSPPGPFLFYMKIRRRYKTAKMINAFTVNYGGYNFTLPVGWPVCNRTAYGHDDAYRIACNTGKLAEKVTGHSRSLLAHDLEYRGLIVPADFCGPYPD